MDGRQIMTADEIRRAVIRISHELVEKQAGTDELRVLGDPSLQVIALLQASRGQRELLHLRRIVRVEIDKQRERSTTLGIFRGQGSHRTRPCAPCMRTTQACS